MRSKIYLILIALFAFSCSSDSSSDDENNNNGGNNNSGNALLVSEITSTSGLSDYVYTERYFYDGNKITSMVEESTYDGGNPEMGYLYNFVYTNNKITRVDEYYEDTSTGIEGRYTFEYDNQGRVSYYNYCYFSSSGTCEYYDTYDLTYSSNGTVTLSYVYEVGTEYEDAGTATLQLDNNGNIVSINDSYQSEDDNGNPVNVTVNSSLEYDNQNSPYKNIVGMNAIILVNFVDNPLQFNAYNNNTSIVSEYSDGDQYQYTQAYDYNEDGYPRQVIVTDGSYSSTIDVSYY